MNNKYHWLRNSFFSLPKHILFFSLFTAIICLSISIANSLIKSYSDYNSTINGLFDYCIFDVSENTYEASEARTALIEITGQVVFNDERVLVGSYGNDAAELLSVTLKSGRYPSSTGEITVEESFEFLIKKTFNVGEIISLTVISPDGQTNAVSYTIVGIIDSYTDRTPTSSISPYYGLPSIITFSDTSSVASSKAIKHLLIASREGNQLQIPEGQKTYEINKAKYSDSRIFFLVAVILSSALICLIGLLTVVAFFISEYGKKQEKVFLLKCSGVSYSGIIKCKIRSLILISSVSSGAGIAAGVTVFLLAFEFYKKFFGASSGLYFRLDYSVAIPVALLIVLASLDLLVTAIIARQPPLYKDGEPGDRGAGIRIGKRFFENHPIISEAIKKTYYKSDAYLSVIICSFLIVISSIAIQIISSEANIFFSERMEYDYKLSLYGGSYFSSFSIPEKKQFFSDYETDLISKSEEVESCPAFSKNTVFVNDETAITKVQTFSDDIRNSHLYSESALKRYESELESFGYSSEEKLFPVPLLGANDVFLRDILGIVPEELSPGEVVVVYTGKEYKDTFSIGDNFALTVPWMIGDNLKRIDFVVTISQTKPVNGTRFADKIFDNNPVCFVASSEDVYSFLRTGNSFLYVSLSNKDDFDSTEYEIKRICSFHSDAPQLRLVSAREQNAQKNRILSVITIVSGLSMIILLISAVVAVSTTIRKEFYGNKKIWAVLRASSVRKRQAFLSALLTFVSSVAVGVIAALAIFGLVLCLADGDSAHELIGIWKPLYLLIPVTFLLISGTVLIYSILNSFWRKYSIIELISESEEHKRR